MKLQRQQNSSSLQVEASAQRKAMTSTIPGVQEFSGKFEMSETRLTLKLTVINTGLAEASSELEITPSGLKNSLRASKDGAVYIGCKKRAAPIDGVKGEILNDFLLPVEDPALKNQHRGRHFVIFYDLERTSFLMRDLAAGFGVFARLEFPIVICSQIIKENHMLSMGESFCIFSISGPSSNSVLQIKAFTNSTSGSSL
jgi:hypothetical protein